MESNINTTVEQNVETTKPSTTEEAAPAQSTTLNAGTHQNNPPLDQNEAATEEASEVNGHAAQEATASSGSSLLNETGGSAAVFIDQIRKEALEQKFHEAINNPKFWSNPKRADRLEQALVVPVYDDKSLQQFFISAREELKSKALDYAIEKGVVPVMPTEIEIRALAEEKYDAKQKKDAEKAAKKADKQTK